MTLTEQGYKRRRYEDYLTLLEQDARNLFGADINLSDDSPLGQWIKLLAFRFAESDEEKEDLYYSAYVDFATGVSLDYCAKRVGTSRLLETYATVPLEFVVDSGFTMPTGVIVGTPDDIQFSVVESAAENGGVVTVEAIALEPGPLGNVPANTITEIITPIAGVNSVNNPEKAQGGRARETDAELRSRYYRSLASGGGASIPSIEAALLQLGGVIDAYVDENETEVEVNGLPPNSIAPFVYGGDDAEIAETIFAKKAGGNRSFGTTEVIITDSRNKQHRIGFTRPMVVTIDVRLTLNKNIEYPLDADSLVKTKIVEYIGGVDENGNDYNGQGLGGDIVPFKVIAAFASIPGIDDALLELSTDGGETYTTEKIIIDSTSIAETHYTKVVIL